MTKTTTTRLSKAEQELTIEDWENLQESNPEAVGLRTLGDHKEACLALKLEIKISRKAGQDFRIRLLRPTTLTKSRKRKDMKVKDGRKRRT